MLAIQNWMVSVMVNDPTLQTYLQDSNNNMNVFPTDIDIQPEQFPCIIFQEAGIAVMSKPQGMHVGTMQLDIYSLLNSLETENVYLRVAQLFNFKDSTTQSISGTLWWIREASVKDVHESDRRMWRKTISLKFWFNNVDNT